VKKKDYEKVYTPINACSLTQTIRADEFAS